MTGSLRLFHFRVILRLRTREHGKGGRKLDLHGILGNIPHVMTVVASDGNRIRIPGIKPKCQYALTEQGKGWLVEPVPAPPLAPAKRRKTRKETRAAIEGSKIEFTATWEEIRQETREP